MNKARSIFLWAIVAIFGIVLITLPVSPQAQMIAGLGVVALMGIIKLLNAHGVWRLISLALGTAIVLRYVYWRTTETLPPIEQIEDFIPGMLLYLAEMYNVLMLGLSIFIVAMPLPPRPSRNDPSEDLPDVDVFIPTYNEDAKLLANTLAAAKAMDYPPDKLRVWLLDDGGTVQKRASSNVAAAEDAMMRHHELQELCAALGVTYLTRERNEHAKAGNLNNGLAHSKAELVAVFDADHAPARDFLRETVGYFREDPKLFLVQTPHFFINPDPVERNLQTFQVMPSENEMFYGIIQRGLDKWNAAFFCGSAAVLSREALEQTSGFSGLSITEDCETALALHSAGWNSIYVDKPLIAGLQPATFASFIGQRSRWAQGMMQILRFRFPLFKRGLTLPQRLCYMSSTLFWLFPFTRATFLFAPLFYLFFDLQIFIASGGDFLAYTLSYLIVNLMMQNYLYGYFRWPWISELYEYVQTVHLLPAVVSVILNPRKPTFKVTAKDESITVARLSEISRPFFVIFAVLLIATGFAAYRIYTEPYKADITLVVAGWNVLNLILAGCALGVVAERRERASSRRVKVQRRCEVFIEDQWYTGSIEDVSVGGAKVNVNAKHIRALTKGKKSLLRFQPHGRMGVETLPIIIRGIDPVGDMTVIGCQYDPASPADHRWIADLIFANSDQWSQFQQSRRTNPGIIKGTVVFLGVALYQTTRGLLYLVRGKGALAAADKGRAQ
ncbi:cellulose synthase catalytic subunit (UDP-forming) [Pseudorhizobium halotolerans]|uniref:Cellulose synthase catalytic subunit [UDP-forming] n=1 Tax=Pseudorhizobium halotolerans TaxID=1233081 RepID=A0ABN7JZY1_9HYPH|nr:UDP-forming cellulose synthase catalytic subunit [Pseudorhizobium halotolerans]CAD7051801.1 cellulose synthase catalytic subunit (UDP-forming) [Pseudorhizobium halotolerans]